MRKQAIFLVVFCGLFAQIFTASPGLRGRITQKGLDYGNKVAIDLFMKELQNLTIPNVYERISAAKVTLSEYNGTQSQWTPSHWAPSNWDPSHWEVQIGLCLNGHHLTGMTPCWPSPGHCLIQMISIPRPTSYTIPVPGQGLKWIVSNLNPKLTANYNAEFRRWIIRITKRGTVTATGRNLNFVLKFRIGRNTEGRPITQGITCSATGYINLHFTGQWSDILNIGSDLFRSKIRSVIVAQICAKAKEEISKHMKGELDTFPVEETIENDYVLNFGLVQFPAFYDRYFETHHKGTVYLKESRAEPPFEAPPIPAFPELTDRMMYVYATDYVINSGLHAAYSNDKLSRNFTKDTVPSDVSSYLRSSCGLFSMCVGTLFPQLSTTYPNHDIEIDTFATRPPAVEFCGNHLNLTAWTEVEVYARLQDERRLAFSVGLVIQARAAIQINGSRVIFNVTEIRHNYGSLNSPHVTMLAGASAQNLPKAILSPRAQIERNIVGVEQSGVLFDMALNLVSQQTVLPKLRELGERGIEIPSVQDVTFENSTILTGNTERVMIVATDVQFTPGTEGVSPFSRSQG